ncbi:phenoloxidase-activating factor 2-like [Diorhabda carinulata]|uniref:phenoloxidase-activating factor 2-like n=1 Tax=Diorhabda carinulata TaxID=1163345 RepID=UPI0025A0E165|nr:phenoloxidase-activating factor 2-like [Diorhabda carinulata]
MTTRFLILFLNFFVLRVCNGQLEQEVNQILDELHSEDKQTSTTVSLQPINDDSTPKNPYEMPSGVTECPHFCVPFFQCRDGKLNTNGVNIIDIRLNDGPCGNALLVCCKKQSVTDNRFTTNPNTSPTETTDPRGCGYRRVDGVEFQITGTKDNEAQYAEFPWMVSIHTQPNAPNDRPVCGGALIHPQAVITAAHCVADMTKRWKVRAGEWDIVKKIEVYPVQEVEVESITLHENYYARALFNDIAFLKLKQAVNLTKNIDTICLPPQSYQHTSQNRCYFTGWGKNKYGKKGVYQGILKKVDLPYIDKSKCQELLRNTRLGQFFELHHSFMCAGGEEGKDACNGDGGSPLVCPWNDDPKRYYFAGVAAWGIGCAQKDIPGVYVDITEFRNWIDNQMTVHRLPTLFYDRDNPFVPRMKGERM